MKFVNVYEVTRKYGDPEEGGWYYNHYNCVKVYPIREKKAEEIVKFLEDKAYGNIYSVLGGREIHILIKDRLAQSETRGFHKEVKGYCYGDQITIEYDFSNYEEAIELFVDEWKNSDIPKKVKSYKGFLEAGERWGWD